jgi:regulator of protease activity HflC (stomatin/prohibitin superfamily)
MREGQAAVGRQQTFTKDNVVVFIEGTLFMKITDSHKSCYAIDQPLQSLTIAAQALVRAQVRAWGMRSSSSSSSSSITIIAGRVHDSG